MKIWHKGKIVDQKDVHISPLNRGFLFGEGLFETVRSYGGKIPFLDKHLARMEWSSTFIGIPFIHPKDISDAVYELIKGESKDQRIKIILSTENVEGTRPLLPSDDMPLDLLIMAEPLEALGSKDYEDGVDLTMIRSVKNDPPPASNMKSLSWLTKMIARRELMEKSVFDGILISAEGYVTETTAANLFWIKKDKVMTAPTTLGLLPGVTRGIIVDLAREEGFEVTETIIEFEDLLESEEIFLTNSTHEVIPVSLINDTEIGVGGAGKVTQILAQAYKARVAEEIEESKE